MSLEVILRDQHNLPVAFYSSRHLQPGAVAGTRPGATSARCRSTPTILAAGEYGIDLQTTFTNIIVDHEVDSAVQFSVDACSPDGIAYNFRQDLGVGHLAMRLTGPLEFVPVAEAGCRTSRNPFGNQAKATMPRRVCIVSPGNLASNPRVLKEADALHERGL